MKSPNSNYKLALVFDDLVQTGGAEQLLEALCTLWPTAPVYCAFATKAWCNRLAAKNVTVKTSFMQYLPFKAKLHKFYALVFLYPLAYRTFNFDDYDVVLSVSSRFAHWITLKPTTLHICYCNSPGRMFWDPQSYFGKFFERPILGLGLRVLLSVYRGYDYCLAQGVDFFIANSKTPLQRIKKFYGRESTIIYPFITIPIVSNGFTMHDQRLLSEKYFLVISRLVAWKKIDLAIEACHVLNKNLYIIGEGPDRARLKNLKRPHVKFLGRVDDGTKARYLQNCQAVIHPQAEDFGLVPLEAMAFGKPVIAFNKGGACETVTAGVTGCFFTEQTVVALAKVIASFDPDAYSKEACMATARRFTKEVFLAEVVKFVNSVYFR